jgi:MFS superfamily sulfate permease-like transporter
MGDAPDFSGQETAVAMSDHGRSVVSMLGWVPGVQAISSYRREWLAKDIVTGIVLTTLLVPQGMAYAELAGLPPITGL